MKQRIKVGAVSYRNTKPLLWGIAHHTVKDEITLSVDYPANLAAQLKAGEIDMALLPVAAMTGIPGARIVSDYGIGADGEVASVCIYSHVPMEEIETVYLDYQSRTSIRLAQILLKKHWKKEVKYRQAEEDYISQIKGSTAGVIIGDRALEQLPNFKYIYDLALGWKEMTGLQFIFAAWIANKDLPDDFIAAFNNANAEGLEHIDEVVAANPFPAYDLKKYYTDNIHFHLDEEKRKGLQRFLKELDELAAAI